MFLRQTAVLGGRKFFKDSELRNTNLSHDKLFPSGPFGSSNNNKIGP